MAQVKTNEQALLGLWFPLYNPTQCLWHGRITAVFDSGRFFLAQMYHAETGKPQEAKIFRTDMVQNFHFFVTKEAMTHAVGHLAEDHC